MGLNIKKERKVLLKKGAKRMWTKLCMFMISQNLRLLYPQWAALGPLKSCFS